MLFRSKIDLTKINLLYIVTVLVIGITIRYWNTVMWLLILSSLGAKNLTINFKRLLYIYAKSWMGRYIPGTLPWILGKIFFAAKLVISKNKLAISSLIEAALQIIVLLVISILLILTNNQLLKVNHQYTTILLLLAVVCIICIIPNVFNKILSIIYKISKQQSLQNENKITSSTIAIGVFMFTISSIANGIILFFITASIDNSISINQLFFIIATSCFASVIGMLAVFAPSGIGVRESIQLFLLSIIINPENALIIVILSRIVEIICDIIFWFSAKLLQSTNRNVL